MSTIIGLEAEAFKRLRAVEIIPAPTGTVLIKGDNENGKTSVLDAIWAALGGGRALPEVPIRRGEKRAKIRLDLGDLTVERTFKGDKSYLTVTDGNGEIQDKPQSVLDRLWSGVAFDPLEFTRLDSRRQVDLLKRVIGLDFSDLDAERKGLYDTRTEYNRELKTAEARLADFPTGVSAFPTEKRTTAEVLAEHEAAQQHNRALETRRATLESQARGCDVLRQRWETLKADLAEAEFALERALAAYAAEMSVATPEPIDLVQIRAKLDVLEEHNEKVSQRVQWQEAKAVRDDVERSVQDLTDKIQAIDEAKEKRLAAAKWPIPDLGFDEAGVTLKGLPLSQASGAQMLRLSCAIGFALNPAIKVLLVRDGSLLDDKNLALLSELAAEQGGQVWVERVGKGGKAGVIIEDGTVAVDETKGDQ